MIQNRYPRRGGILSGLSGIRMNRQRIVTRLVRSTPAMAEACAT